MTNKGVVGGGTYGSVTNPDAKGSGGGGGYHPIGYRPILGGAGGGVVKVNASGNITVDGIISSNGAAGEFYIASYHVQLAMILTQAALSISRVPELTVQTLK